MVTTYGSTHKSTNAAFKACTHVLICEPRGMWHGHQYDLVWQILLRPSWRLCAACACSYSLPKSWISVSSYAVHSSEYKAPVSKFLADTHTMLKCALSNSVVLHFFMPSVYSCASNFTRYRHFRDFRTSREKNDMKYSKPISHNYWRTRMLYYSVLWAMLLWCLYSCHVRLPMLQKKRYIHTGC